MYANTKGKNPCHDHDKDPTVHVRVPDAGNTKKKILKNERSESAGEWRTALIERRLANQSVSLLPDWSIASFDGWLSPRLLHRRWMDTT